MGSSDTPSEQEQRAFDIVALVMGAQVEARDGKLAPPRTPDAELIYPDGRRGWLEVSTLGVPAEFEMASALISEGNELPAPGIWDWTVIVRRRKSFRRAKSIAGAIALECERHGVTAPHELPSELLARDPDVLWAANDETVMFAALRLPPGACANRPVIRFQTDSYIVSWRFSHPPLPAVLEQSFEGPVLRKRIEKLRQSNGAELHLYLRVTREGVGDGNLFKLITHALGIDEGTDDSVGNVDDIGAPPLPREITHLWIDTEWGRHVSRWTRGIGWDHPDHGPLPRSAS